MSTKTAKRGRPRKKNPLTPAERMRAYRQRKKAEGFRQVSQWRPVDRDTAATNSDHQILDARSLTLHCKIARKISADPRLLETPRRNLRRWSKASGKPIPGYIIEWQQILEKPWPEIMSFITGITHDAVRLRQSSPFAGVLTPQERKQVYDTFRT